MSQKKQLSILEFSRLTGINRDNLRFYDRIGLLKPEIRGENGYRYYTRRQLGSAYLVGSLRLLGVGIEDIRRYSASRTPEEMLNLFAEQESRIQKEIEKLQETSGIMKLYADMAREALCHSDGEILLEERRRERIFLCPPFPTARDEDEAEVLAYEYAGSHGVNLGYPMGVMVTEDSLLTYTESPEYQYYLKADRRGNAWKPGGLYVVVYGKSNLQDTQDIYLRLLDYIREQGLEVAGNAYGEYLLDDLAIQDSAQYYGRIEILVKHREKNGSDVNYRL
ncbi:MerR family transcriptional regulator [Zongyangia hominis]|uniref:MerR family transcriptional regulator n=1 Tax=Zongyangia hominis TaxID=2763677 RepID=A0A926EED8_9FIRM|nr:MerR family transcriptional regulator [Zongyangia hominis]MBC8570904.1 MerR family transcriptional regulator [Zongyangia hominis]